MRIAEIQKLTNQSRIVTRHEQLSHEELFAYLNALVTKFETAKRNMFNDETIDFQEPLKSATSDLCVTSTTSDITESTHAGADFNLLTNFNLVDFAAFLDTVIKTVANKATSSTTIANLAARNIFRTHINQQISNRLKQMFLEDHLQPWTTNYIDSLSNSQIGLEAQELYDTMSDPRREHFYIFDIDGTLKQAEPNCSTHAVPNITDQVKLDLINLSRRPNTKVLMLTSRSVEEVQESNVPHKEIPVITGCGLEVINGERIVLVENKLAEETRKFTEHLYSLLDNLNIDRTSYSVRQYMGSIYIHFIENNFTAEKLNVMKVLKILMPDSASDWSFDDRGSRFIYFNNSKFKHDKDAALRQILREHKSTINERTNIYILGDADSDYKAMEALKRASLPEGARAINIAIGDKLADKNKYPAVDDRLSSHHVVSDLLNLLSVKS